MINIIDNQFNWLGIIEEYESFISSSNYSGISSFELHLHENVEGVDKLIKENIIYKDLDKAYIIMFRSINSITGKVVIRGLELKSFFKRWLVFPPSEMDTFRVNDNVETIIKLYASETLIRKGINNIIVKPSLARGIKTVYQSRYKVLSEEIEKLSVLSGLGWDIKLDLENKKFVFDVVEGRNLSSEQNILAPAIFSIEYDNIANQELVESLFDYSNVAIVGGQGEGRNRKIEIVGDSIGLDSYELFVDARDVEDETDLPDRALQKLSERKEILNFDSEVLADQNLKYGVDFKLGDIVTIVNNKWNLKVDRRIEEVTEIFEVNGFKLEVSFGEGLPTIIDKVNAIKDIPITEGSGGSGGSGGLVNLDGGKPSTEYGGIDSIKGGDVFGL